jgi:hypothetical protein
VNIYLIERTEDSAHSYDYFQSAVVRAPSPKAARETHPRGDRFGVKHTCNCGKVCFTNKWDDEHAGWVDHPDKVTATLLGKARKGAERGVILAHFIGG